MPDATDLSIVLFFFFSVIKLQAVDFLVLTGLILDLLYFFKKRNS